MRLVLFEAPGRDIRPGLLTERGVVDATSAVPAGHTPQATMQGLIDGFDTLRPALERLARNGAAVPVEQVRLRPPLPRPGKILACIANYWEHGALEARPLNMFLKNPDAVVGPGDTIVLPEHTEPWIFMHEAELALVVKGPAKNVRQADWPSAVFGYTGMIDVSARARAAERGRPAAGWGSRSTPSRRWVLASPRVTRSPTPTTSTCASGSTASCATTTTPTTWSTWCPSWSSSRRAS